MLFLLVLILCHRAYVLSFINPGVGIGIPTGFEIPKLGSGGYVSTVYKVPPKEEVSSQYYAQPQYEPPVSQYSPSQYESPAPQYSPPQHYSGKYQRDVKNKPLYYGDTFDPIAPGQLLLNYQSPFMSTTGPENRFSSSSSIGHLPTLLPLGEPMLQAVKNPFVEEVEIISKDVDFEIPDPDPEPVEENKLEALTSLDPDDPFEPEAEVDIGDAEDFLPSINPLATLQPTTYSIHQSLELLPASYLDTIRQQREFEDSVADLRESYESEDMEHNQMKRDQVLEVEHEPREIFSSDAAYNKDKIHAYNIYKSQWTTSGDKKLVVDASVALRNYFMNKDKNHVSAPSFASDIDNQLLGLTERDNTQTQVSHGNKMSLLTLTPSGPSMPFLTTMIDNVRSLLSEPIFPRAGSEMMFSIREVMHNMRNAHVDQRFDIYDFLPLFAVLFATALILTGIFPNSLALTGGGGTFSFGRSDDADPLDLAIDQLQNGVLIMSAIRDGGQCSAKLACKLGQMTRESFESPNMILDAMDFIVPTFANKYSNFTDEFSKAVNTEEYSSCSAECSRCLVI